MLLILTIAGTWKQPMPSGFGVLKAMAADPYSGPWGGKKCRDSPIQTKRDCSCKDGECKATDKCYCANLMRTQRLRLPAATGPAAVLAESIQGVGGTMQFTK
ncbi:hypothetical protein OSTOST_24379, partial [Ostertagia ostertagi]